MGDLGDEESAWLNDVSDELECTRDTKMWGTDKASLRKVFGVNMHPVFGGWYAYRALVILKACRAPGLPRPEPMKFLSTKEKKRILSEYNLRHDECVWRDLSEDGHPPENRYSPEEYFFFLETKPQKRKRYLEMRAACLPSPPPLRL